MNFRCENDLKIRLLFLLKINLLHNILLAYDVHFT